MLDENVIAKIGDFGSAEKFLNGSDMLTKTIGTYQFFSPECCDRNPFCLRYSTLMYSWHQDFLRQSQWCVGFGCDSIRANLQWVALLGGDRDGSALANPSDRLETVGKAKCIRRSQVATAQNAGEKPGEEGYIKDFEEGKVVEWGIRCIFRLERGGLLC